MASLKRCALSLGSKKEQGFTLAKTNPTKKAKLYLDDTVKENVQIRNAKDEDHGNGVDKNLDQIASKLIQPLIRSFESKMGRKPTEMEYNSLLQTLLSDESLLNSAAMAAMAVDNSCEQDLDFDCCANDVMRIEFVSNSKDSKDTFGPEFTHQIFDQGEEPEYIFGYKDLAINIRFTGPGLHLIVELKYSEKHDDADEILPRLQKALLPSWDAKDKDSERGFSKSFPAFLMTAGEFDAAMEADKSFTLSKNVKLLEPYTNSFAVFQPCVASVKNIPMFHHLFQFLPLLYIDAASAIDVTDENWETIMVFEKTSDNGLKFAGFTTLYRFTETKTLRLSQILILPPYRKKGLGGLLVKSAYEHCTSLGMERLEVETPISESFQKLLSKIDYSRFLRSNLYDITQSVKDLNYDKFRASLKLSELQFSKVKMLFAYEKLAKNAKEGKCEKGEQLKQYHEIVTNELSKYREKSEDSDDESFDINLAFASEIEWHSSITKKARQICQA
eukprot:jgi/Bigna1/131015/aug1.13_g5723